MANLRDIYRYFGGVTGEGAYGDQPWSQPGAPSEDWLLSQGQHSAFDWRPDNSTGTSGWAIREGSFLDDLNKQYGGAATLENRAPGQGGGQWNLAWDMSKLPQTRFGSIENTVPVDDRTSVRNRALVYNDPNLGMITHRGNVKTGNEWLGPALMAAVGMGAGSLIGAAGGASAASNFRNAMGLTQAARGVGSGRGPLSLLGALGGFAGVPSWATALVRMGLQQRNRRGG